MPWKHVDMATFRQEFVLLALQEGANRRDLCKRFCISPKTGYKWIARLQTQGASGLLEQSREPIQTPLRTTEIIEAKVVALRHEHPTWGGRKIAQRMRDLGIDAVPTTSTVSRILHRHGLINEQASERSKSWQRFEHAEPNDL